MKFTRDNVLSVYKILVEATGGTVGVRDEGMLLSAIEAPYQTFGGMELYPSIEEKGARVCFNIINSHPFVDGNKRVAVLSMLSFFKANNINLKYSNNDIIYVLVILFFKFSLLWKYILLTNTEKRRLQNGKSSRVLLWNDDGG